jgi:hypothetical protein
MNLCGWEKAETLTLTLGVRRMTLPNPNSQQEILQQERFSWREYVHKIGLFHSIC